jgi:hypothetical protein
MPPNRFRHAVGATYLDGPCQLIEITTDARGDKTNDKTIPGAETCPDLRARAMEVMVGTTHATRCNLWTPQVGLGSTPY